MVDCYETTTKRKMCRADDEQSRQVPEAKKKLDP
jgi:hypothetical protein